MELPFKMALIKLTRVIIEYLKDVYKNTSLELTIKYISTVLRLHVHYNVR